ncbi:MAG: DUF4446 family protein [Candidatus Paceibacterota bacterium]|jgi:hypothetical protein
MALDANTIIIVLLGIIVLLIGWIIYFEVRLSKLLRGKDANTLEDSWNNILAELKDVQNARREIETYLRSVEQRLKRSIQGVETIRFNPFKDLNMGSNQSFSTAFLDEDGNGVVVSSLYSRDRVSVYSKPLKKHASEYGLTEEEKEAVAKARPGRIA